MTLVAGATVSCGITNTELGVPALTQDKTVNAATAHEGDTLTYTMTVGNTGTADATGVTATESLPAGVTFVSATASTGTFDSTNGVWTVGTVAVGATETLTVTATVNAGTEGTTLVDRFEVSPPPGVGPPEVENPCPDDAAQSCASTDILPPPGSPELVQSKSVDQTTAVPGDTLTYTMGVANDGTADATGVTATDTLPAGVTFVAADTHGAGTYDSVDGRLEHRDRRQRHVGDPHDHRHRERRNGSQHPDQPLHHHLDRNPGDRPRRLLGRARPSRAPRRPSPACPGWSRTRLSIRPARRSVRR